MTLSLEVPASPDALYRMRGPEVAATRPIMQGDVFTGLGIPGVDYNGIPGEPLCCIITHPCSMRAGPALKDQLQVVRVTQSQVPTDSEWKGHFLRKMPLPGLRPDDNPAHFAAEFEQTGLVRAEDLQLEDRIAVLSDVGVRILQQRLIVFYSRYQEVDLGALDEAFRPVVEEVDLLEEWNEAFCGDLDGEEFRRCLVAEAVLFDEYLTAPVQGGGSLRSKLREPRYRAEVRRSVRSHIESREAN